MLTLAATSTVRSTQEREGGGLMLVDTFALVVLTIFFDFLQLLLLLAGACSVPHEGDGLGEDPEHAGCGSTAPRVPGRERAGSQQRNGDRGRVNARARKSTHTHTHVHRHERVTAVTCLHSLLLFSCVFLLSFVCLCFFLLASIH